VLSTLQDITARLERVGAKQYDTKPIWEQALAEIMETRKELQTMDVRLDRIESQTSQTRAEMLTLRADFKEMRGHMKELA
jgi:predicted  nucleic acid-binding Zn-ribbon protein